MPLEGYATTAATARYRERFKHSIAAGHFRSQQGLSLSSVGIGTYLGNADAATDENYTQALVRAVESGVNVIDSAANYRFQRSERSVGAALDQLAKAGFGRDELVVCTKGGYLPFDSVLPKDVPGYIEQTFVLPGIATFSDIVGGSHCMTPAYLQNQLDQSLKNMGLEAVDVYYVHNPESQLGYVSESEFFRRLRLAFELLERNRTEGKLKMYGVATWNGFRVPPSSRDYHSLERMTDLAKEIAGENHGFRFIQLPLNLAMPEALTLKNQTIGTEQLSTLEAARTLGITAVASASILQGRVAHDLPESVRQTLGSLKTDAQTAIQFVRSSPGVTTALVGMSHVEHVEENLELAGISPVDEQQFVRLFQ